VVALEAVAGWPSYIAMGAVGGPNITTPTPTSIGGDDDFGGKPIDVVFKYAGMNGDGDPGVIDPPTNAYRMTSDLNAVSGINGRAARVAIVEYTAQMSGGQNYEDFTNTSTPSTSHPGATYIMARHFSSLIADAAFLAANPVKLNGNNYYGTLILNPDLLGAMQQNNYLRDATLQSQLRSGSVQTAVRQALCLMTTSRTYTNRTNPNGLPSAPYLGKTYTGTPVQIFQNLLGDGYPVWSINGGRDPYWNTTIGNTGSQVEAWFQACVTNPVYNTAQYVVPNFPLTFEGWVAANNWLIRAFAPAGTVTFGWQDNMWAVNSGFWLHKTLSAAQINAAYAGPVSDWLKANAPSAITSNKTNPTGPDYFVFDRYEMDDSAAPGQGTLYNARSWDNLLTAVGQVSNANNNIPIMLWQIPGSHIPNRAEAQPQLYNNTPGSYVFSTAPVYFFGDSNLTSNLGNIIMGVASASTNTSVGSFVVSCGATNYNCINPSANYKQYLLEYNGVANNYDWSKDNGRLAFAANQNVFSILWGGGNTTNVIKNFSNPTDNGWLAQKLRNYYANPTPVITR